MKGALPAFTGHPLDRADHWRSNPEKLAELRHGDGLLLTLDGLAPTLDGAGQLAWTPSAEAPEDAELVFLGLLEGRALFGAVPSGEGDTAPAYTLRDMWRMLIGLPAPELALYGGARSLLDWHARHKFCAKCGHATQLAKGGWQRTCPNCGAEHFPRTDPVQITLVEHDGNVLLGRAARYPPRSYSALSGFIEPGESIEESVVREIFEEAGIPVRDVTYVASQPWPFPSQLMIGCHAYAESAELTVDYTELEDARWFTRAEVVEAMEKGQDSESFVAPLRQAVAHHMLGWWLENR